MKKVETIIGSVIREKGKNTKVVDLLLKGSKFRLGKQENYTLAMRALHQILTGTLIYSTQRKKAYRHLLLQKGI
ncbi:hypothetical protein [Gilliamella sp. WF3-4]|jgi:hypothetical protein|uniref:hypothetical protein n=1 Tax=Gilliamella sp. WF3-4 TaxID=3120255 RepID=UPI00080EE77B|nr:hypothetical protein [Gilliamella apicola]OCG17297.1 hypothetical protein A9G47_09285 [Gilliamella apicola]